MSRARRALAIVTGAIAVLGFGFVVAVAAGSLPGREGDDSMADLDFRSGLDLTPVLAWILLALAIAGVVLYTLGMKQARPRKERGKRSLVGILVGLAVFLLIFRFLRPVAESWLEEAPSAVDAATDIIDESRGGSAAGWLFSLLLAAVLAATITRIGLSIRTTAAPFHPSVAAPAPRPAHQVPSEPVGLPLGADPRGRILRAYREFESAVAEAGQPRDDAETTRRHASRAGERLGLDPTLVASLAEHHAAARYGRADPILPDAESAERSWTELRRQMTT